MTCTPSAVLVAELLIKLKHTHLHTATALTDLDTPTINKLLTALNECTEWGQVFILDSLAGYQVNPEIVGGHN